GGFVIPGLVDCHAHLTLSSPAGEDATDDVRVRASADAQVTAGVLLIREPGGRTHASRALRIEEGGPRIQSAGRWLAGPGRFFEGWAHEADAGRLTEAAEEELAAGGGWVKVIGDWRVEDRFAPSFDAETLRKTVDRIHALGGRVAIH